MAIYQGIVHHAIFNGFLIKGIAIDLLEVKSELFIKTFKI